MEGERGGLFMVNFVGMKKCLTAVSRKRFSA
jgi:hypothetical protein